MDRHKNIKNRKFTFNFIREIPQKLNWTKNKVDKKNAIAFNFTEEISKKITREKKVHQKILKMRLIYNFISHGVILLKGRSEKVDVWNHF